MEIWKIILSILIIENAANFFIVWFLNPFWNFKKCFQWSVWVLVMILALVLAMFYFYVPIRNSGAGVLWGVLVLCAAIFSSLSIFLARVRFQGVMMGSYYHFSVDRVENGRVFGGFQTYLSDERFDAELVTTGENKYRPGDSLDVSVIVCTPRKITVEPMV